MHHRAVETRCPSEASAIMARAWSRHEIVAPMHGFHMRFENRTISPDVSLGALAYGTPVRINPVARAEVFLVQMPIRGTASAAVGRQDVPIGPDAYAVLDVRHLTTATFSADFDMVVLRVQARRLVEHLEALLGVRPRRELAFAPSLAADGAPWRAWRPVARALEALCAGPEPSRDMLDSWEAVILSGLLHAQPNTYSDDLARPAPSLAPRHVRRAERYIEENAGGPLTSTRVAAQVGVSVRALFDGFKTFRGITPADHIRSVRLARAREDLRAGGMTVAEVAARWGFAHAGHFAAQYRRRYGEPPRSTRRSGR